MNKLYIVDNWVPFPDSEYGGVVIYVANSIEEVTARIISGYPQWEKRGYKDWKERIAKAVKSALVFELAETHKDMPEGEVYAFIT